MSDSAARPVVCLVDATHHLYRSYFAVPRLTNARGEPTNAVYGFTTILLKLMAEQKADYFACCFDRAEPTFRHEMYEPYKARREAIPDDLIPQMDMARRVCGVLGVPAVELAGYEADDLIATLARLARERGCEAIVASNDKDLFQLVRPGLRILYQSKQGGERLLDEAGVEEVFGVKPSQVVDVLALWGDPTDNIPGVPGIGEKGAKDIIRHCGSLEEALRQSETLPQKRYRGKIAANAEQARLSYKLATVNDHAPVEWGEEALRLKKPDPTKARALFEELNFRKLMDRLEEGASAGAPPAPARNPEGQDAATESMAPLAADESGLKKLEKEAAATLALAPHPPAGGYLTPLEGLLLSASEKQAFLVEAKRVADADFLLRGDLKKICHDLKRLLLFFPDMRPPWEDCLLAAYVLDPESGPFTFPALARRWLNLDIAPKKASAKANLYEDETLNATALQARLLPRLWRTLAAELEKSGMRNLYETLELPLAGVLAAMERRGVLIDREFLKTLGAELESQIAAVEAQIHEQAGGAFNIQSPQQLASVLFEKLGLPVMKKTAKTKAASTENEVLEALASQHPIVTLILDYRQKTKLKSTYVDALARMADPATGRVHTSYNQWGAATGRLSSSDPNLQNIPIRTAEGRRIRRAFVAPPGWRLVSADYSQIELRLLAHLSGDPLLCEAFERGEDIHARTAVEIMGARPGAVSPDERRAAKTINFGVIYGMSAFALAKQLEIDNGRARALMDQYFGRYREVARFRQEVLEEARRSGWVRTMFGRRRRVPDLGNQNRTVREAAERAAFNTPLQGSAADLMKRAMIEIHRGIRDREDVHLVMQVHDELVLEAREDVAEDIAMLVRRKMEDAFALRVPLVVDVRMGTSWGKEEEE